MATIVVTGGRAPAALDLARVFAAAGHRVVSAESVRFPLTRFSGAVARSVRVPSPRASPAYAEALGQLAREERAALVVPACEEVFYLARAALPCPVFAPGFDMLARLHDKDRFAQTAATHGLAVPETRRLTSPADLDALGPLGPWVLKPAFSRFGAHAHVPPHPRGVSLAVRPSLVRPWVAQRFVDGPQVCAYAVARAGRLAAYAAYRTPYTAGRAGVWFRHETHAGVRAWVEAFVAAEGLTGQVAFDFIERADGSVVAIECNPRATSGVHLLRHAPGFADAFTAALVSPDASTYVGACAEPIAGTAVRLTLPMLAAGRPGFPSAWRRAFAGSRDAVYDSTDVGPAFGQVLLLAELLTVAARHRSSPLDAATRDLAWDGPADDAAP